jgi:hypothetical protein
MINHARTLLLNQPRDRMHYSDYGYEYVPPTFKPVVLPPPLLALRRILFGATPDNYFINFRVNEIMSYIHSTELAEYALRLDPRITYWPKTTKPYFEPSGKRVLITQTYGEPKRLIVAGELDALTAIGKSFNLYTISLRYVPIDGVTTPTLDVRYEGKLNSKFTVSIPDLSAPPIIALPDTKLNLRLNPNSYQKAYENIITELADFVVIEGYSSRTDRLVDERRSFVQVPNESLIAQWLVEAKVNPAPLVTTVIPAIEMLGEPVFLDILGLEDKEPYLTFKNLWFDHPLPAYRLAGIVLALIYRTEELRG